MPKRLSDSEWWLKDEVWLDLFNPTFHEDSSKADRAAKLWHQLLGELETGPRGATRVAWCLENALRLTFPFTDTCHTSRFLFNLSLGESFPPNLPAAVLSFAIITRYDLSVFASDWRLVGTPLLAGVFSLRRYDSLSVLLDVVNVLALVASLMAMIQITTANRVPTTVQRGRRAIRRSAVLVAFLLAASVWLWSAHWERAGPPSVIGIDLRNLVYWMSFGLTSLLGSLVSFSFRARLPLVVSLFGLLLFFAMFMPT